MYGPAFWQPLVDGIEKKKAVMVILSVCCHLHLPPHNIKGVGGCLSDEAGASPKQEHDPHRQLPQMPA